MPPAETPVRMLVLDCGAMFDLDVTAAETLDELDREFDERGITLALAEPHAPMRRLLRRTGLYQKLGEANVFTTVGEAIRVYAERTAEALSAMAEEGLRLDDHTVERLAEAQGRQDRASRIGIWVGAIALAAIALATRAPILVAPAMNGKMWSHPATQENVEKLKARGVEFIGPEEGMLACGYEGLGRLWKVNDIAFRAEFLLTQHDKLIA